MIGKKLFFLKNFINSDRLRDHVSFDDFLETYTRVKLNQFINSTIHNDRHNEKEISLVLFKIEWQQGDLKFKEEAKKKMLLAIKEEVREQDILAPWDEDEFILLLTECNNESAHKIAELIKGIIESRKFINLKVSLNYGISVLDVDDSVESFIEKANDSLKNCEKV